MGECKKPSGKDAVFDANEDLRSLFMEAYTSYRKEVIGNGKCYNRFADDFIVGHRFYCAATPYEANARNVNVNRIDTLLHDRRDLAEKYFRTSHFGPMDYMAMLSEFDSGTASGQASAGMLNFESDLSSDRTAAIAAIANDLRIFKAQVTPGDMANLFSPSPSVMLAAANNRKLAILFDALAGESLVCTDWQKVIAATGCITSSSGSDFTQSSLSSALNGAREEESAAFSTIRKRVRDMVKSD